MSAKKNGKRTSGDPRKGTSSGRTTRSQSPRVRNAPSDEPIVVAIDLGPLFEDDPLIVELAQKIEDAIPEVEPLPARDEPYRVPAFACFDPLYDGDPYYEKLREGFAREMKAVCGEYYPDPSLAEAYHDRFVENLRAALVDRIPQVAQRIHDMLEKWFRARWDTREEGSFEEWDRTALNSFFAHKRLLEKVEELPPFEYLDEVVKGPSSSITQGNFSYLHLGTRMDDESVSIFPVLTIMSKIVTNAFCEGYTPEEIIDGITTQLLGFELTNLSGDVSLLDFDDNGPIFQTGLTRFTQEALPDGSPHSWGKMGHAALVTFFHVRVFDDAGLGYLPEDVVLEILNRHDPMLIENMFAGFVNHASQENSHLLYTEAIKRFVNSLLGEKPELTADFYDHIEMCVENQDQAKSLEHALQVMMGISISDWSTIGQAVRNNAYGRAFDTTFFLPPGFKALSRELGLHER